MLAMAGREPIDTQCIPLSSPNEDVQPSIDTRLNSSLSPTPTTHNIELEVKQDHHDPLDTLKQDHHDPLDTLKQDHHDPLDTLKQNHHDPLDTLKQDHHDPLDTLFLPSSSVTESIQSSKETYEIAKETNLSSGLSLISQFVSSQESSDDEDSSSDTSDDRMSLLSDTEPSKDHLPVPDSYPKVKGEIDYRELPGQNTCDVPFPANGRMLPIGEVSHYTEKLVVIKSFPNTPPINEGSVIWRADMKSIARVFEIFGPVKTPYYSILVQSSDHANEIGLMPGDTVYVVPGDLDLTSYVFTTKLLSEKGCDASWKNDHEVPTEYQDYSDDEQESLRRKKSSSKQKGKRSEMNNYCRNVQEANVEQGSVHMEHNGCGPVNGPSSKPLMLQPEPRPIVYPPHVFPVPFPVPVQPFPVYPPPNLYPPPWPRYPPPY